ncbi:MAG: antibiotic biosynthesis monooxygenase [bacterium]
MGLIADTPRPPYFAVIFTSLRNAGDLGYEEMSKRMAELVADTPGFLGLESAREEVGITVSYWKDLESIKKWKHHSDHLQAQRQGKEKWYSRYKVRISKVDRDYSFE